MKKKKKKFKKKYKKKKFRKIYFRKRIKKTTRSLYLNAAAQLAK